jgi:hypothetical protein
VVSSSPSDRSLSQVYVLLILLSPLTTFMGERERCYSFILSRTPHAVFTIAIILVKRLGGNSGMPLLPFRELSVNGMYVCMQ